MLDDFISIALEFGVAVALKVRIGWIVIMGVALLAFIFGWRVFKAKYLRG